MLAAQGTMLHSRNFISYHGDRFKDLSLLIFNEKDQLRAIFPAAEAPNDCRTVVSHPGITYGGLVHLPEARADEVAGLLAELTAWYSQEGYTSLLYKSVPPHLQHPCLQADQYALWRMGAQLIRRDLWNVLDLSLPRRLSKGHRWSLQKARKGGITIHAECSHDIHDFHAILVECLGARHGTQPVHMEAELIELHRRFPQQIRTWGAYSSDSTLIAGVWLFELNKHCWHTQYIAANDQGRALFATDLLLETIIERATENGVRYFSFGASTEDQGKKLNPGLYSFKAGFGSGSVAHDFYHLDLN